MSSIHKMSYEIFPEERKTQHISNISLDELAPLGNRASAGPVIPYVPDK